MYRYCPRDKFAVTKKTIDGVDLFQCAQCHGVWIPKESLLTLAASKNISPLTAHIEANALPSHFRQGMLPCPLDNTAMYFHSIGGIEVDLCSVCHGVWLDKGELESLPAAQAGPSIGSHVTNHAIDLLYFLPPIDSDTLEASVEVVSGVAEVAGEAASTGMDLLGDLLGAIAEALFSG